MGIHDHLDNLSTEGKTRIVQELVPGKQITIAHLIANPDKILYEKLGLDPSVDYARSAIGVLTISPAETAVIAADIAVKAAGIELGFVDRFSGTLIITGTVSETEVLLERFRSMVDQRACAGFKETGPANFKYCVVAAVAKVVTIGYRDMITRSQTGEPVIKIGVRTGHNRLGTLKR